jgi:hypothetical protein
MPKFLVILPLLLPVMASAQLAKMEPTQVDESQVPAYTLPNPLLMDDGTAVTSADQWPARRTELLNLFAAHQYGFAPSVPVSITTTVLSEDSDVLNGMAMMKQVEVILSLNGKSHSLGLLLFLPNAATHPAPAFLGLNFYGNHTVHSDPRIRLHESWSPNNDDMRVTANRSTADSRGLREYRWPVKEILSRGYALATVYAGDIDPDYDDGFHNGVHGLFGEGDFNVPIEERWGTLAAWAWGLSRILDYILADEPGIDSSRVMVIGHSRMGKAALWAAACDTRFAAAISNNSGCAGSALHRRRFGERIVHINMNFPHWLNQRARQYNERESEIPVDQHQLLALVAPRPLYIASAAEDLWADPKGEYLSLFHAQPVWRLLGVDSTLPPIPPPAGGFLTGPLSYHLRPGTHDLLPEDWQRFLNFADRD